MLYNINVYYVKRRIRWKERIKKIIIFLLIIYIIISLLFINKNKCIYVDIKYDLDYDNYYYKNVLSDK